MHQQRHFQVSVPSRGKESNNWIVADKKTGEVLDSFRPLSGQRVQQYKESAATKANKAKFPSPLGAKSPTIGYENCYRQYQAWFPSPLGAKSPTIALTKHAEYDY